MSLILLGIIFPCMLPYFMSYLTQISEIITPIGYFVTEFFHLYFNKFSFAISKSEKGFHLASPVNLLTFQVLDNWDDWKKRFRSGVISLVLKRLKARINKGVFVSPQVHKANQLYMYNCCVALNEGKLTHHHGVHSSSPGL